ncbi:MAG: hypothetical protein RL404_284 [Pseudomonadota bacterium]|jgi:ferredoxin--NADP+ reductase
MNERSFRAKPVSLEHIVDIWHWTPNLLSFTVTRPPALSYLAGQYARLGVTVNDQLIWRAFSFVSAPHQSYLEFLAVLVPDGLFSARLKEMQIGDDIHVELENYGFMTADRFSDAEDCWMLATGTGIGPYVSMLRDRALWARFSHLVLVHGVRTAAELTYREELQQMRVQAQNDTSRAQLMLVTCISRDAKDEPKKMQIGSRITDAWDAAKLEACTSLVITPERSRVMMCGNPHMIEDLRTRLHKRGLTPCRRLVPGQFLTENYW